MSAHVTPPKEKCQGATNRMGDVLARLYLTGRLTGGEVQKLAEAAGDNTDPVCKKLAEAGNAGAHRGNCHRDIMAVLSGDCDRSRQFTRPTWFPEQPHANHLQLCVLKISAT